MTIAQPAHPSTREERGLELYRTRGHEIRLAGEDLYLVPSCTGRALLGRLPRGDLRLSRLPAPPRELQTHPGRGRARGQAAPASLRL
jgi:hypothetical protein